ncbi:putative cAMP-dependent protein kinase, regulatory subunit [Desulfamplus magnetovallimortis]|uniref:Putative cAMP-dependent protein kinase, regulatory subunit n=1 Tax=Desulfamplus magnetovallimortis TaxID=1246637 RepID=A0A1W1H6A1_9BACT|nr:cyclic nucleotide-binding domain-containing protein [Desulfamplus magnetovallimortis]SLM27966.1 putative cAMP-dependent protein kinase, regulatory subunit [Desulfamplus magnetovallimortis]
MDILRQCILFQNSSDSDIKNIATMMNPCHVQEGESLALKGNKATSFFILVSGMMLLELDGGKSIVMAKPGDFAGLDILSSKGTYCSSLTALKNGEVLTIKRGDFLDLIQEDSSNAEQIMQSWSEHISNELPFLEVPEDDENQYQY